MRIVFVGTVDFSRHCLEEVLRKGGNVTAVLTLARQDAGFHADYADLSDVAARHKVPVHYVKNINAPDSVELIRGLRPDVIFVFGWSQLITRPLLAIPPLGCIGTHPALLPRNRGRHPIVWALVEGLTESGLTFLYLDEGADSGDILWQKPFPITLEDDAASLHRKIKVLASEAIQEFLPKLQGGTAPRTRQDHSQATYWRKRTEQDGEIDWTAPAMKTYNLVRALARPYVGAHTYYKNEKMIVWRAGLPQQPISDGLMAGPAGTILDISDAGIRVQTGNRPITLVEVERPPGIKLEIGDRMGKK